MSKNKWGYSELDTTSPLQVDIASPTNLATTDNQEAHTALLSDIKTGILNQNDFELRTVKYVATADSVPAGEYVAKDVLYQIDFYEKNVFIKSEWYNLKIDPNKTTIINPPTAGTFDPVGVDSNDVVSAGGVIAQQSTLLQVLTELTSILTYSKQSLSTSEVYANTDGTGYSSGDWLTKYDVVSTDSNTILSTFWFNNSTDLAISAPTLGDYGSDKELQAKSPTIENITTASPFIGGLVVSEYKIIALDDYQFNGATVPASYSVFDCDGINYILPSITALSEDVILIYHV